MQNVFMIATTIFCTALGQVLLKLGSKNLYFPSAISSYEIIKTLRVNLLNLHVIFSLCLTFIAGMSWILVVQRVPLSRAYPFMSLNYVLVYFISWCFFQEMLSPLALLGISFIVCGTILIGLK